jgi:nicotinamide-nucleotide adenylyltransferase
MERAIYDLPWLFALRETLETLDVFASPNAHVLYPEVLPVVRRIGLLCGSFNPLTLAHVELAEHAREIAGLDLVLFTVAKVTVEKEHVTGLSLEDRLLILSLYAQRHEHTGVAIVNRGLYFEQAQAFRSLFGAGVELSFVVGMDKLLQILDPKYYVDRDAALQQLFALTSLIVANRGVMAQAAFDQLLDQPGNRSYRPYIRFCALPEAIAELSATAVRESLSVGQGIESSVPRETALFLAETRTFSSPVEIRGEKVEAYATRRRLFELLFSGRSQGIDDIDFFALMHAALSHTDDARALRSAPSLEALLQLYHPVLP